MGTSDKHDLPWSRHSDQKTIDDDPEWLDDSDHWLKHSAPGAAHIQRVTAYIDSLRADLARLREALEREADFVGELVKIQCDREGITAASKHPPSGLTQNLQQLGFRLRTALTQTGDRQPPHRKSK